MIDNICCLNNTTLNSDRKILILELIYSFVNEKEVIYPNEFDDFEREQLTKLNNEFEQEYLKYNLDKERKCFSKSTGVKLRETKLIRQLNKIKNLNQYFNSFGSNKKTKKRAIQLIQNEQKKLIENNEINKTEKNLGKRNKNAKVYLTSPNMFVGKTLSLYFFENHLKISKTEINALLEELDLNFEADTEISLKMYLNNRDYFENIFNLIIKPTIDNSSIINNIERYDKRKSTSKLKPGNYFKLIYIRPKS